MTVYEGGPGGPERPCSYAEGLPVERWPTLDFGEMRRAVERPLVDRASAAQESVWGPGYRELVGFAARLGMFRHDPTAAGRARRTQPFYVDPDEPLVFHKGQAVGPSTVLLGYVRSYDWRLPATVAEFDDGPPAYAVDRYGGTYSWTWEPRRWWDPRGWSNLLVRLEEWWFGDDLHAEQAVREWATANRVTDFSSPLAWKRACKAVVYATMAERRAERRAQWRRFSR